MLDKAAALAILAGVYILIISNRVHRSTAVISGGVIMVGFLGLREAEIVHYIHWEALGLIFGMFVLVAGLSRSGFFRWIGLHVLRLTNFSPLKVFAAFAALSAILAAFMDSITVLLFMTSLTLEVARILGISPVPFVVAQITSANIGGSATMVGDPPNIVIGTALDFTFLDFVVNTGPIAMAAFFINLGIFVLWERKALRRLAVDRETIIREHGDLDPFRAVTDLRLMRVSLIAFSFTITLLVLHHVLDLLVAFVAILGASLVLLLGGRGASELVEHIDWETIVFLAGLFIIVGGIASTGLMADMATSMASASGGNPLLLLTMIIWISVVLSAVLDNIPYAAAMVHVIEDLARAAGLPVTTLAWTLAMGTNLGGNATPVGASANVVGLALAEKHAVHISWGEYCRRAFPGVVATVAMANIFIVFRYLM